MVDIQHASLLGSPIRQVRITLGSSNQLHDPSLSEDFSIGRYCHAPASFQALTHSNTHSWLRSGCDARLRQSRSRLIGPGIIRETRPARLYWPHRGDPGATPGPSFGPKADQPWTATVVRYNWWP